ncbi:MAG: hypothetical protein U0M15_03520 [Bacillota bacterium]|nr:hypothetical protein [Bacillota bacterium]
MSKKQQSKKQSFDKKSFLIMVVLEAVLMGFITFMGIKAWFPVSSATLALVFVLGTVVLASITAVSFVLNPPKHEETSQSKKQRSRHS